MPIEVANVLHQRVKQGQVTVEVASRLIERLLDSGVELREPPDLHSKAIELSSQLQQGAVYDAHYLALAETLGCELWTADERFYSSDTSAYQRVRLLSAFVA
jgi:predicted nucleic acid-binding protein